MSNGKKRAIKLTVQGGILFATMYLLLPLRDPGLRLIGAFAFLLAWVGMMVTINAATSYISKR